MDKSDFQELKDIPLHGSNVRYYVCNSCKAWNEVKEADLIDPMKTRRKKKKDIHMKIDEDFALVVAKFSKNFGGYQPMLAFLINDFNKKAAPQ